jgi:TetR/AcrR family transcriptional regulator, cholesterol catabolism regulator
MADLGSDRPLTTSTTRRKSSEVRRAEIARIAARLFASNGYHSTGMSELSEAVGLGKGALYYHIGSKEDLLYEISARHVRDMVAFGEALADRPDLSPPQKLHLLSRELMRTISENLPELTVFFHEVSTLTGDRARKLIDLRDRCEQVWLRVVGQGVDAGVFRDLDSIAIKGVLGMHNYSYIWLAADGRLSPDDISDVFCDLVLNGYLRRPEKPARSTTTDGVEPNDSPGITS